MAKSSKGKHGNISVHSRAARRAPIPTDRPFKNEAALTSTTAATTPVKQFPVHHYGGISKKKAKPKSLSRAQRLRREKGMERAEAVVDQLEVKKASSIGRAKKVHARSAAWDELNGKILLPRSTNGAGPEDNEWVDDDSSSEIEAEQVEKEAIQAVEALHMSPTTGNVDAPPVSRAELVPTPLTTGSLAGLEDEVL